MTIGRIFIGSIGAAAAIIAIYQFGKQSVDLPPKEEIIFPSNKQLVNLNSQIDKLTHQKNKSTVENEKLRKEIELLNKKNKTLSSTNDFKKPKTLSSSTPDLTGEWSLTYNETQTISETGKIRDSSATRKLFVSLNQSNNEVSGKIIGAKGDSCSNGKIIGAINNNILNGNINYTGKCCGGASLKFKIDFTDKNTNKSLLNGLYKPGVDRPPRGCTLSWGNLSFIRNTSI